MGDFLGPPRLAQWVTLFLVVWISRWDEMVIMRGGRVVYSSV